MVPSISKSITRLGFAHQISLEGCKPKALVDSATNTFKPKPLQEQAETRVLMNHTRNHKSYGVLTLHCVSGVIPFGRRTRAPPDTSLHLVVQVSLIYGHISFRLTMNPLERHDINCLACFSTSDQRTLSTSYFDCSIQVTIQLKQSTKQTSNSSKRQLLPLQYKTNTCIQIHSRMKCNLASH